MLKSLKKYSFLALIILLFTAVSCLTNEEKEVRTFDTELAELDDLLVRLADDGYDIDTTELGVYYIVHETGAGETPQEGDTVSVEYTGAFTNGSIFDASIDHWPEGIWEFIYPGDGLIAGFNDALSVMQKGTTLDAIITSNLAYGAYGAGSIPGYTTLIFSLKLHDIKPKSD